MGSWKEEGKPCSQSLKNSWVLLQVQWAPHLNHNGKTGVCLGGCKAQSLPIRGHPTLPSRTRKMQGEPKGEGKEITYCNLVWVGSPNDVLNLLPKIHTGTYPHAALCGPSVSALFKADILEFHSLGSSSGSWVLTVFRAIPPPLWVCPFKNVLQELTTCSCPFTLKSHLFIDASSKAIHHNFLYRDGGLGVLCPA